MTPKPKSHIEGHVVKNDGRSYWLASSIIQFDKEIADGKNMHIAGRHVSVRVGFCCEPSTEVHRLKEPIMMSIQHIEQDKRRQWR